MSALVIIPQREPRRRPSSTSDPARIARELAPGGVRLQRWPASSVREVPVGSVPSLNAIRLFRSAEGWVGDFSGDSIARTFPSDDELVLEAHATSAAPLEVSP